MRLTGYIRGKAVNKTNYYREKVKTIIVHETRRYPHPQQAICDIARDVETAQKLWRVWSVDLAKNICSLIPDSVAAKRFYLDAKLGRLPLCCKLSPWPPTSSPESKP